MLSYKHEANKWAMPSVMQTPLSSTPHPKQGSTMTAHFLLWRLAFFVRDVNKRNESAAFKDVAVKVKAQSLESSGYLTKQCHLVLSSFTHNARIWKKEKQIVIIRNKITTYLLLI